MTDAAQDLTPVPLTSAASASDGGSGTLWAFTLTTFLSALLLFSIQPMFAKMVLPVLGGSPSVWAVAMFFFQAALLVGYCYAHALITFVPTRLSGFIHLALCLLAFVALPIQVPQWFGEPPAAGEPYLWQIGLFAVAVGLPFVAVAANAPLFQAWFAGTGHKHANDPYFLYAASNLGSLIALLAYPFVLEPAYGVSALAGFWAVGFGLLVASIALLFWLVMSANETKSSAARIADAAPADPALRPTWLKRLAWIGLAFVPSALLTAFTTHVTTDVASAPLLWVLPLALYLLTFVLVFREKMLAFLPLAVLVGGIAAGLCYAFSSRLGITFNLDTAIGAAAVGAITFAVAYALLPLTPKQWLLGVHVVAVVAALLTIAQTRNEGWFVTAPIGVLVFFSSAMVAHRTLYEARPAPRHLTEFYLWMSLGGALGGLAAALLAPRLFSEVWEYPILLALSMACRPGTLSLTSAAPLEGKRLVDYVLSVWILFALAVLAYLTGPRLIDSLGNYLPSRVVQWFSWLDSLSRGDLIVGLFGLMVLAGLVAISFASLVSRPTFGAQPQDRNRLIEKALTVWILFAVAALLLVWGPWLLENVANPGPYLPAKLRTWFAWLHSNRTEIIYGLLGLILLGAFSALSLTSRSGALSRGGLVADGQETLVERLPILWVLFGLSVYVYCCGPWLIDHAGSPATYLTTAVTTKAALWFTWPLAQIGRALSWMLSLGSAGLVVCLLGLLLLAAPRDPLGQFLLACGMVVTMLSMESSVNRGNAQRSYFGIYRVQLQTSTDGQWNTLVHGTTLHGAQRVRDEKGESIADITPSTYYHPDSPMAKTVDVTRERATEAGAKARVGVIGLGSGSLACHAREDEKWTFFEIDPVMIDLATKSDMFTYMENCQPNADIIIGDARLTLNKQANASFDLIIVDAFSSDAVPVHLMTAEALKMYLAKLKPDGVALLHISNRYLDLDAVLAATTPAVPGLQGLIISDDTADTTSYAQSTSTVALFARRKDILDKYRSTGTPSELEAGKLRAWTDDYSDILGPFVSKYKKRF